MAREGSRGFDLKVALSLLREVEQNTTEVQEELRRAAKGVEGAVRVEEILLAGVYKRYSRWRASGEAERFYSELDRAISLAIGARDSEPGYTFEDPNSGQIVTPEYVIGLAQFQKGLLAITEDRLERALEWFQESMTTVGNQATQYQIGYVLLALSRLEDAISAFEHVVNLNPDSDLAVEAGKLLIRLRAIQIPASRKKRWVALLLLPFGFHKLYLGYGMGGYVGYVFAAVKVYPVWREWYLFLTNKIRDAYGRPLE